MRILIAAACAAAMPSAVPASAQVVDMNTVTCKDFTGFNKDITFAIVMWLDAYYRDEDDPPVVDFDKMAKRAGQLTLAPGSTPMSLRASLTF